VATGPTIEGALAGYISDLPSSDLFTLDTAVEEMISTRGWQFVQEVLERGRENLEKTLDAHLGEVPSKADFARYHGFRNGTRAADSVVNQIRKAAAKRREKLETEAHRARAAESASEPTV
jgi:hypothetical protein